MNKKNNNFSGRKVYKKILKNNNFKKEIINALKNNEFKLYVQPKYETQTKAICGGEVLIRWHKNNKIIYPNNFISNLEKSRLIHKLDFFVLKKVCSKLQKWNNNKNINKSITKKFIKLLLFRRNKKNNK